MRSLTLTSIHKDGHSANSTNETGRSQARASQANPEEKDTCRCGKGIWVSAARHDGL